MTRPDKRPGLILDLVQVPISGNATMMMVSRCFWFSSRGSIGLPLFGGEIAIIVISFSADVSSSLTWPWSFSSGRQASLQILGPSFLACLDCWVAVLGTE